jgi:hypothetical protein
MSDPLGVGRLTGLAVGLAFGLVAAAVCGGLWNWRRRHRPGSPTPVAGLALAAASALGIAITATTRPAGTLLPGLVVLAAAGGMLRRARAAGARGAAGARALGLAGAAALALAGATVTAWSLVADGGLALGLWTVAAICVTGALLHDFDRHRRRQGLAPVLLAVSAAGVYATIPDVEAAVVVVGATLPIALLGWPGPLAWPRSAAAQPPPSLGEAGALATAGLLVWTVAAGGSTRPGSIVGGLACLGLLALEPLARRLGALGGDGASTAGTLGAPRPLGPGDRLGWAVLAAQVALVAVAARVVGRTVSAPLALLLAAAELGAILAAAVAVTRLRAARRRAPPGGDEIPSG